MTDNNLNQPVLIQASRIDVTAIPSGFSQVFKQHLIQQGSDLGMVAGKANDAGQGAYDAQVKNAEQDVELAEHERRITANESELANHEQRISSAEETIADHETRLTEAEQTIDDHEQRISANETELADHEQRISAAESEISSQGQRLSTAEQAIKSQANRISESEHDIDSLQSGLSSLAGRVSSAEGDIDELQSDYVSKQQTSPQTISSPLSVATSYSVNGMKVVGERVTGFTAATGTALKGAFNASDTFTVSAAYTQAEIQAMAAALVATRQRVKALEDALRSHGLIN